MELKTFIKETLKDIIGAVQEAQEELNKGLIVPPLKEDYWKGIETGFTSYQSIEFEVSVNAVEQEGSEAKLNVLAAVVGGGVKGDSSSTAERTAKLSFRIPVKLPIHETE